jgi:hypothetical protein
LSDPLKTIAAMEEVLWELVEEVASVAQGGLARCHGELRYTDFHTITRSRWPHRRFDKEIFEVVSDREAERRWAAPCAF